MNSPLLECLSQPVKIGHVGINPRKSGNSYPSDAIRECQKSSSPRIRDNTFEGAKCSTHFPRLTRLGQWTPRVDNPDDERAFITGIDWPN